MTDERVSSLPHLLSQLSDVVGVARALAFASDFGGRNLSVPRRERLGDDHRIVRALGRAGADRLADLYGGETILVPMGPAGSLAEARRRLARALDGGASADTAAAQAGLHRRTAFRMRRRMRDGRQGSLF